MVEIIETQKPLDRMLASFPAAYERGNGFWAHDDNPRFDFRESPEGDIRLHSWTGRTDDDILAMGNPPLTRAALFARPGQWSAVQSRDQLDLLTLAEYMRIDWQWLQLEGYSDGYSYTNRNGRTTRCVKIGGYCTPDGQEHSKHQVRLSLHKEPRFLWDQNTPGELLPCGLHYIPRAIAAGYLAIGEGGSDWATMTFHGIPFLGIPGAEQAKTLDVELVKDIPVIYLIEEPDQAKKLREKGQGFYKNMRQHLRDHGYTGEIFSLRFMESTGYKDPSDLHKSIYATCDEQAEGPFRLEVKQRFLAAIEQAIEQAIPEGNEGLYPVAKARDWSNVSFEEFYQQVWAVSSEYLSPIQKGIVCYLFLYMRQVEPDELGWHVDAEKMAPAVGLRGKNGPKKFLEHLSYLYQKLGILSKEHRAIKDHINGEDGEEQVRYKGMDLYIQSNPTFYTPGGYCVVTEDQHKPGGPREKQEEPKPAPDLSRMPTECEICGSTNVRPYAAECLEPDCGHVTYPSVEQDEPLSQEQVLESINSHTVVVESTLVTFDSPDPETPKPEYPNLGYSGNEEITKEISSIESITLPQFGVFGNVFSEPVTPAPIQARSYDGPYPPEPRPTFCHDAGWTWSGQQYVCEVCRGKREQVPV